jgi:hypothetical protein
MTVDDDLLQDTIDLHCQVDQEFSQTYVRKPVQVSRTGTAVVRHTCTIASLRVQPLPTTGPDRALLVFSHGRCDAAVGLRASG